VALHLYQKILGKLVYASTIIPGMSKLFTPLYEQLKGVAPGSFVGLGKKSVTREVLEVLDEMLEMAHRLPAHITELVGPDLPHFYGTVDASSMGFGGTVLPCTHWLQPSVWRLEMPPDLRRAVVEGRLPMVDCEFVGYFIENCVIHDLAEESLGTTAGMTSFTFSDNSPTVDILHREASRATSPTPARTLRWLAFRQKIYRSGPQDSMHWPGEENTMADVPSRSFDEYPGTETDAAFATKFAHTFPLPPQLKSWRFVRPRPEICSAAFYLLRQIRDSSVLPPEKSGNSGLPLPPVLARTLTSLDIRDPPDTWNASTCSWPLLLPSGKAVSTAESPLQQRRSKERYATADKSWQLEDFRTLARRWKDSTTSTQQ
jgi:hypothetical protein